MAGSEFLFALQRDYRLVDDARLGGLNGITPDLIVLDSFHPGESIFAGREPDMFEHVSTVLHERFYLAKTFGEFRVYLPRPGSS